MNEKQLIPVSDWHICVVKVLDKTDKISYPEAMYRRVGDHIEIRYSYNYYAQDFKFN